MRAARAVSTFACALVASACTEGRETPNPVTERGVDSAVVDAGAVSPTPRPLRVLFFQEEGADVGWYHTSNPIAEKAFRAWGSDHAWEMTTAKDSTGFFTPQSLAHFDVVVYLLSSGTVLDAGERAAFKAYIEAGGGFAGVHSAAFTDPDWRWYIDLVGVRFATESDKVDTVDVLDQVPADPLTVFLPRRWTRADQWYKFLTPPEQNPRLELLLSLDEATFPAGYPDAAYSGTGVHPIAWRQQNYDGARSFFTGMGHTDQSYSEPLFLEFVAGGIAWAGALARASRP